jgi:hypothetical protein
MAARDQKQNEIFCENENIQFYFYGRKTYLSLIAITTIITRCLLMLENQLKSLKYTVNSEGRCILQTNEAAVYKRNHPQEG